MIYFIRDEDSGLIKIGTTIHMAARFKQLVEQEQLPLDLVAVTDGGFREEQRLHVRFGRSRVRGEWFRPDPDLVEFIASEARPWDGACERGRSVAALFVCTVDYAEWLERLGKHLRTPASTIVDHALVRYAQEMGFKEEAPER